MSYNDIKQYNCYSHPGSYLSEISIKTKNETIFIQAGNYINGFKNLTINTEIIKIGQIIGSLSFLSSHKIKLHTEQFDFTFYNSDQFINQEVKANKPLSELNAHGKFIKKFITCAH